MPLVCLFSRPLYQYRSQLDTHQNLAYYTNMTTNPNPMNGNLMNGNLMNGNLMNGNPYVVLRKSLKLTQEEVARLGGTTEQYVRRLEQGMVSNASGAVSVGLYHAGHAKGQHTYMRTAARSALRNLRANNPAKPYTGPVDYHNPTTFEKYVEAWFDYWMQVSRSHVTRSALMSVETVYALCRLLLLHPYVVQRYAKVLAKAQADNPDFVAFPEPLTRALNDADLSRTDFDKVIQRVG